MNDIMEISHLRKRCADVQAVNDLSFRVQEGSLFAFLGINGAGKSATTHYMEEAADADYVLIAGIVPAVGLYVLTNLLSEKKRH